MLNSHRQSHADRHGPGLALVCGLALASFVSLAPAQPAGQPSSSEQAPLRGPRVVDREGPAGRFGPGENANRPQAQRAQQAQQGDSVQEYLRIVRVLGSERVPEEVRLTQAQQDVIRPIAEAHAKELGAYYTTHKDTLVKAATLLGAADLAERIASAETIDAQAVQSIGERLREGARSRMANRRDAMDAPDARPDARPDGRPEPSAEQREAMQMLAGLRRGAPAGEKALTAIKATLTDEQREFIDARARQMRERVGARQGAAGAEGMNNMNGMNNMDGMPGRVWDEARPRGAASPVKSDRLGKLLEGMTAEEQDRLAEMLERRQAGEGRGAGRGEGRGQGRGEGAGEGSGQGRGQRSPDA